MKEHFTTEELKGYKKQPIDTCPFLNDIIIMLGKTVNQQTNSLEKDILEKLESAFFVIEDIDKWNKDWEVSFSKIKGNDIQIEAFRFNALNHLKSISNTDINKLKLDFTEIFTNEFLGLVSDLAFSSDNINIPQKERKYDEIYVSVKKEQLEDIVEEIRSYAQNKRAYTNQMKIAYKNYSLINDLNDLIEPYEIIQEELNKNDKTYNLGVLESEQSMSHLIKSGIFTEVEVFLLNNFSEKNVKNIIFEKISENGFNNVSYYNTLSEFQNGKGYKTEKLSNLYKNKLKK